VRCSSAAPQLAHARAYRNVHALHERLHENVEATEDDGWTKLAQRGARSSRHDVRLGRRGRQLCSAAPRRETVDVHTHTHTHTHASTRSQCKLKRKTRTRTHLAEQPVEPRAHLGADTVATVHEERLQCTAGGALHKVAVRAQTAVENGLVHALGARQEGVGYHRVSYQGVTQHGLACTETRSRDACNQRAR
jgi:hypothetical protein